MFWVSSEERALQAMVPITLIVLKKLWSFLYQAFLTMDVLLSVGWALTVVSVDSGNFSAYLMIVKMDTSNYEKGYIWWFTRIHHPALHSVLQLAAGNFTHLKGEKDFFCARIAQKLSSSKLQKKLMMRQAIHALQNLLKGKNIEGKNPKQLLLACIAAFYLNMKLKVSKKIWTF